MERNETQTRSVKYGDYLTCQKSGQYLQEFRKKVRKTDTDGRTDGWTDRRTERKPKVPFGFAGRGLKRMVGEYSDPGLQGLFHGSTSVIQKVLSFSKKGWHSRNSFSLSLI